MKIKNIILISIYIIVIIILLYSKFNSNDNSDKVENVVKAQEYSPVGINNIYDNGPFKVYIMKDTEYDKEYFVFYSRYNTAGGVSVYAIERDKESE